jgi:predicted amidophosphoribosyltransferase
MPISHALDLLAPPRCALCRGPGALLCGPCLRALPIIGGHRCERCGAASQRPVSACSACRGRRLGYDRAVAALEYTGAARDLVHAFKDGGLRSLAAPAAALIRLVIDPPDAALVTWVPADPLRQAIRGYHPPQLLAQSLAEGWGMEAAPLLRGPLHRRPQRGLSRAQRRANVRHAFVSEPLAGGSVVLVDDVRTTGATISAAAQALRRSGCDDVLAVTLARADSA